MPVLGTQVIKSIQRGSTVLSGLGATTAVTINAVDLDKSFVSVSVENGFCGGRYDATSSGPYIMSATTAGGKLTSTTAITLVGGTGTYYNTTYRVYNNTEAFWEVIEYA
tara:strand:+ start:647 stop:973 length:327 start_codon:yes stop_codon:yes gene_type:complete